MPILSNRSIFDDILHSKREQQFERGASKFLKKNTGRTVKFKTMNPNIKLVYVQVFADVWEVHAEVNSQWQAPELASPSRTMSNAQYAIWNDWVNQHSRLGHVFIRFKTAAYKLEHRLEVMRKDYEKRYG